MSLDWPNERYVRLYVRRTPDMACWRWEAAAIWPWLMTHAGRDGVIETRKGVRGLAAMLHWFPLEVVEAGAAELLEDGCLVATSNGYALPNYVEAQTAIASDTKRKADQRARERLDRALNGAHDNNSVTRGHDESQDVTTSHEKSLRSDPSRSEPNRAEDPPLPPKGGTADSKPKPTRKKPRPSEPTADEVAIARRVLDRVGQRTGIAYQGSLPHLRLIARHLRDGITERELRGIAAYVWSDLGWADKPEMHRYFRPETLFGPEKLHTYLDGARAWLAREHPETRGPPLALVSE